MLSLAKIFAIAFFSCLSCLGQEPSKADYIFFGGDILTMQDQAAPIETLAIKDGKIIFLGNKKDALYLQTEATQWINLQQGTLAPGFINTDCNLLFQGLSHFCTDLSSQEFRNSTKLKEYLKSLAKNGPILGMGFDPTYYKDKQPLSLKFLDELSKADPIIIINKTGDVAYANSKALQLAAISKHDTSPYYMKKKDGNLCGIVLDPEYISKLIRISPIFTNLDLKKIIKVGLKDFVKHGYTTIIDTAIGLPVTSSEYLIKLIQSTIEEKNQISLHGFVVPSILSSLNKLKENASENFSLLGVSFILDGSIYNRLASLTVPYKKKKKEGTLFYSTQELLSKTQVARQNKHQICFKASGDKAISQALECCSKVQMLNLSESSKLLIRQASLSSKENLESMLKINACPSFSMNDLSEWGTYIVSSILPTSLVEDLDLTNSAYKLNTKCSITNGGGKSNIHPLVILQTAVTRKNSLGNIIHRQERLSVDEALKCLTINPAYQLQLEETIGTLEVGKQADFVILSTNPKKVPSNKIGNIKVLETWKKGRRVNLNLSD